MYFHFNNEKTFQMLFAKTSQKLENIRQIYIKINTSFVEKYDTTCYLFLINRGMYKIAPLICINKIHR